MKKISPRYVGNLVFTLLRDPMAIMSMATDTGLSIKDGVVYLRFQDQEFSLTVEECDED